MGKWGRRLLLWALVSVGATFLLVSRLPSRREIAQKMTVPESVASKPPETFVARAEPGPSPTALPTAPPVPIADRARRARERVLMMTVVEEDPRDIRVCSQLGQIKVARKSEESLGLEDVFGKDRTDSLMEAYRMPVRAIFQEPAIADLMREIDGYGSEMDAKSADEREGFLSKVGFYARVARASASLIANRRKFEVLGDRATHLAVLAKMALANPKLRDDSRLMDFCRRIQDFDSPPTPEGLRTERTELLGLIQDAGLKPKDLEFEPTEWTKFSLKQDSGKLTVSLSSKEEPK